jgi:hypothetical protein
LLGIPEQSDFADSSFGHLYRRCFLLPLAKPLRLLEAVVSCAKGRKAVQLTLALYQSSRAHEVEVKLARLREPSLSAHAKEYE